MVRPFNLTMSNRGRRSRSVEPSPSRRRDPSPSSHVIKAKAAPHMGVPNLLPSVEQRHATQPDPVRKSCSFLPAAKTRRSMVGKMTVRGGRIASELISLDNFVSLIHFHCHIGAAGI